MVHKIEIKMKLPSLNDYIKICRRNKYEASNFKRDIENDIIYFIRKAQTPRITNRVKIKYTWIEKNKRRDIDNVASAKKYINDALVKIGIINNDSPTYVVAFEDKFVYDKFKGDRVIVEIEELER